MNKQNIVYIYNGILFSRIRQEFLTNATKWMNLEDTMLNEITSDKKTHATYSYELSNSQGQKVEWQLHGPGARAKQGDV